MQLTKALKEYFGHSAFRDGQKEIVEAILAGENIVAVLPTGAGKSICYQLPSLISENCSIVISPLIALMKDQVDALNIEHSSGKERTIAGFVNSTQEFREVEITLQRVKYGEIKLLYVAPERLENKFFLDKMAELKFSYLFVDEAHCISEWGHNFRPSYLKIKDFIAATGIKKISAFTATATPDVVNDIIKQLGLKNPKLFVRGFERENLAIEVFITSQKKEKVLELLLRYETPAIVYTSSRKAAEEVSEFLFINKVKNAFYHAGLKTIDRTKIQESFMSGKNDVIIATNAFGMGIDKKNIRTVIHYNMPGSIENYYQEIGRGGRDGKLSNVILLFDNGDTKIQQLLISQSYPDERLIKAVYDAICLFKKIEIGSYYEDEIPINYTFISGIADREVSKGLVNASLNILQNAGYIKIVSEYEKKFSVEFIVDNEYLRNYVKRNSDKSSDKVQKKKGIILFLLQSFGAKILQQEVPVSLSFISNQMNIEEREVDAILLELHKEGIINYDKPLPGISVLLTKPRVPSSNLKVDFKKLNDGFLRAQKKLEQMIDFVYSTECRFNIILNYFGENLDNYKCGKCDNCVKEIPLSENVNEYLKDIIIKTLFEVKEGLTIDKLISVLKGKSQAKDLQKISTFGSCVNHDFFEIRRAVIKIESEGLIKHDVLRKRKLVVTDLGIKKSNLKETIEEKSDNSYEKNLEYIYYLRLIRDKAAQKFHQPKQLIIPEEVLFAIASAHPKNKEELMKIEGVNERMWVKVGEEIISLFSGSLPMLEIEEAKSIGSKTIPGNLLETAELIKKGKSLKEIAEIRKIPEAVVSMQVETILEFDKEIDVSNLFQFDYTKEIIEEAKKGYRDLKELKQRLGSKVSYPEIRIALAVLKYRN